MTLTVALVLGLMALYTGIFWLMPRMARPTLPFGVRIPEQRIDDPTVRDATGQYRYGLVVTMLIVTVTLAALALIVPPVVVVLVASLLPLGVWLIPYLSARRTVLAAKREGGWFDEVPQRVVTDTTWRTSPPPYPWAWAVPAIVIALATLVIGIVRYPALPDRIVMHIGTGGPDRFADKTVPSAFGLVAIGIVLTAALLALALLALRARPEVSAAAPRESAENYRRYALTMARMTLVLAAGMNLTFLIASLMVWDVIPPDPVWGIASAVPSLAAAAAMVVASVRTGQSGYRLRTQAPAADASGTDRDDDAHWKGGLIYYNREDPAVWVSKRYGGIGWTLNYARPAAWVFTVGFLAVTIGIVVWAVLAESGDETGAGEQGVAEDDGGPGDEEASMEEQSAQGTGEPAVADLTSLEGTPVGERLDWVLAALADPPDVTEIEDVFAPSMLTQVPATDLRTVLVQLGGTYTVTALHSSTPTTLAADIDDGTGQRWQVTLAVAAGEASGAQITGLAFQPPLGETATFASWDEAGEALSGLAPDVGYLAAEVDGTTCRPIAADVENVRRPLGSVFKLYVLGAVADAVEAGDLSWDDEITIEDDLKSLPSGTLQEEPAGSTVTVAEAAELMISISDNTATDHLIALVGRDAVEQAQAAYGHGAPELNRPFLTTREMFQLKWQADEATRTTYAAAGEAVRRDILDDLTGEPLTVSAADIALPVETDTIEWFASPSELCAALVRLAGTSQEQVDRALGANPIVRLDPEAWSRTAAKGGSEPGVLSFAWLLERASDGRTFVFAITLHDDSVIDQNAVIPVVEGAIALLE